ncbi:MAG: hypothetical protein JJ902_22310 [Roseibium sp.]|nr:hypothetical protein [Roseibium sp.]
MSVKTSHSRVRCPIRERKTPFWRHAVARLAVGLIAAASATVPPALAAPDIAPLVTFGNIPTVNACGNLPGTSDKVTVALSNANFSNVIDIPADKSKLVDGTIALATWGLNAYRPPASRVINPGNICLFEKCTTASLTLTCGPARQDGTIDKDADTSVRWLDAE